MKKPQYVIFDQSVLEDYIRGGEAASVCTDKLYSTAKEMHEKRGKGGYDPSDKYIVLVPVGVIDLRKYTNYFEDLPVSTSEIDDDFSDWVADIKFLNKKDQEG